MLTAGVNQVMSPFQADTYYILNSESLSELKITKQAYALYFSGPSWNTNYNLKIYYYDTIKSVI